MLFNLMKRFRHRKRVGSLALKPDGSTTVFIHCKICGTYETCKYERR